MNISVTKAAKEWGVSRTTIYQKVNNGQLSRTADKKIDTSEMLRVFGEPASKKCTEQSIKPIPSNSSDSQNVQIHTVLEHKLELEKLKNEYLQQQVHEQQQLIAYYQEQINQFNKTLEKANSSIQDLTRFRLLEFKGTNPEHSDHKQQSELIPEKETAAAFTTARKKKWFIF